jgi:hypothetical protein
MSTRRYETEEESRYNGGSTPLDRWLKKRMRNLTVMRRYVFGSYFMKAILITLMILVGHRVDANTNHVANTSCLFIAVLEDAADREEQLARTDDAKNHQAHVDSAMRLNRQAKLARATGISCPPRGHIIPVP